MHVVRVFNYCVVCVLDGENAHVPRRKTAQLIDVCLTRGTPG